MSKNSGSCKRIERKGNEGRRLGSRSGQPRWWIYIRLKQLKKFG